MNVGPMINGYLKNELAGSGMVVWTGREKHAAGEMNDEGLVDYISRGYVQKLIHLIAAADIFKEHRQQDIATRWVQHRQ